MASPVSVSSMCRTPIAHHPAWRSYWHDPATALPANCEARIEPKQINAIVSEMLALAECYDADGPWDCTTINNM